MVEYIDLIIVIGTIVLGCAFPAAVGSFSRGEPPRLAILALFAGGVMILYANASRPGGYSVAEMPDIFIRVFTGT